MKPRCCSQSVFIFALRMRLARAVAQRHAGNLQTEISSTLSIFNFQFSINRGGKVTAPISLPDTDTQRTYDLDGLGNWKHSDYTPVDGSATEDLRQHNKLNEITSRAVGRASRPPHGAAVTPPAILTYDKNGNLTDDGTLLYEYDALNRLIEVKRKTDSVIISQ